MSVHVSPVEGLCLAGGGGLAQSVLVPAGSARPVSFSVVPTAATAVSLKVVARGSWDFPVGDAVSKVLQIQKEGAIHTEEIVYELNPLDHRARTLEIPGSSDPNIIPDGDFSSFVRVTGGSALQSVPRAASDSCEAHRPLLDPVGPQTCLLTLALPFPL